MATNRTFTMIKPDAVRNGHIGAILKMINDGGFRIVAMKYTQLSLAQAGQFYEVHSARPFYGELTEFMSSGPIVAAILEKGASAWVYAIRTQPNPPNGNLFRTSSKMMKMSGYEVIPQRETNASGR